MKIKPFLDKAKISIKNCGFLTVWEGSVRSSKTVASLAAFWVYVMLSEEKTFVMTGATQGSIYKNCIISDFGLLALSGGLLEERTDKNNNKYIGYLDKKIYYYGGDNVSSYKKIRGATYGGWYADEIDQQHKNTIIECFNRTVVSTDRKNFWTMNPNVPDHWIYTDYIDRYLELKLNGYRWFHFDLDDNPALTEERKEELKTQYSGVFYQRFILGMRVRAEGMIYVSFSDKNVISDPAKKAEILKKIKWVEIGGDFGGNKSATTYNPVGYWIEPKIGLCAACIDEVYDTANLGTDSITANLINILKKVKDVLKLTVTDAYLDSAEQLIIKSMRTKVPLNIHGSLKKPIIDRIRLGDYLLSNQRLVLFDDCKNTIKAFRSAVWDSKSMKEDRLDNGTTNIDSLDSTEYTLERHFNDFLGA